MKKVATIIYAVGWTQHTFGTQIIRTAAILQLLLGNVGRAGGGVNALRGHSNIQGATDMAGVFDILPGYLKMPTPGRHRPRDLPEAHHADRRRSRRSGTRSTTGRTRRSSPCRSSRRCTATPRRKDNDWAFHYLPKIDRNYSWTEIWDDMYRGNVKGLFAFGMNGVAIGPNSQKNIEALKKADWLVVGEIYPGRDQRVLEGAGHHGRGDEDRSTRPSTGCRAPASRKRTARSSTPRAGCSGRTSRCRRPATRRLDQDILAQIFLKVRELYQKEGGKFPDPDPEPALALHAIRSIRRSSEVAQGDQRPGARRHHRSATGQAIKAGQQLPGFAWLRDDGTTLCGNWIYSGSWTEAGNQMARRGTDDPSGLGIYPNWAWSWPANRRVLYNRASCDPAGKPWDPERRQVWWNEAAGRWVGNDVPDFKVDSQAVGAHGPVHHEPGRRRPPLRAARGVCRRAVPRALRADRKSRSPIRCIRSSRPIRSSRSSARRLDKYGTPGDGLQHRLHDLSADRALSLLDEEQSDERAARARAVRRDSGGAGRRDGHHGRREA